MRAENEAERISPELSGTRQRYWLKFTSVGGNLPRGDRQKAAWRSAVGVGGLIRVGEVSMSGPFLLLAAPIMTSKARKLDYIWSPFSHLGSIFGQGTY